MGEDAVGQWQVELIETALTDLERVVGQYGPSQTPEQLQSLLEARERFERSLEGYQRPREASVILADLVSHTALLYGKLEDPVRERDAWLETLALLRSAQESRDVEPELRMKEATALAWLGQLERGQGRLAVALKFYRTAHALVQSLLASRSEREWVEAESRLQSSIDTLITELPGAFNEQLRLAVAAKKARNWDKAITHYERALRSARAQVDAGDEPKHAIWAALDGLGEVHRADRKWEDALKRHSEALPVIQALAKSAPTNELWQTEESLTHERLGLVDLDRGAEDLTSASAHFEENLRIREALYARSPANSTWKSNLAYAYQQFGIVAERSKKPDEALVWYRKALELRVELTKSSGGDKYKSDLARTCRWVLGLLDWDWDTDRITDEERERVTVHKYLVEIGDSRAAEQLAVELGFTARKCLRQRRVDEAVEALDASLAALASNENRLNETWVGPTTLGRLRDGSHLLRAGKTDEASAEEALALAYVAYEMREYGLSADYFSRAFEDASIGRDPLELYNGACAASLSLAKRDEQGRREWTKRALEWLGLEWKLRRAVLSGLDEESQRATQLRSRIKLHHAHATQGDPDLEALRHMPEFKAIYADG